MFRHIVHVNHCALLRTTITAVLKIKLLWQASIIVEQTTKLPCKAIFQFRLGRKCLAADVPSAPTSVVGCLIAELRRPEIVQVIRSSLSRTWCVQLSNPSGFNFILVVCFKMWQNDHHTNSSPEYPRRRHCPNLVASYIADRESTAFDFCSELLVMPAAFRK